MSKLSARVLASYSGVTIPMAAMGMPIAVYLPPFYSDGLGLSLVTVGTVFTLARIWDVVTDPVMGLVIDRFDSRWGRRKHWIALSIPILLVSVWAVFMPDPDAVSGGYLLFWMIALYVGYTMLAIAHQSWGAELTTTYDDRSRLFGWREIFVIGGMTAVLAIPALIELTGRDDQASKVASMGWFCLILFPLTVVPTLMFVPDTHQPPATSVRWREALALLVRNAILWRLLAADLTSGFGTGVAGAMYIFVASYVFLLPSHASIALLFYFLAGFLAMPLWLKLAYRVGKDTALKISLLYGSGVMFALVVLAEPGNVPVLWAFTILYGVAFGAAPTLLRSMMADLTDDDELRSGRKRSGLFFALLTTTNKLGAALAVGISFAILEKVVGFAPGPDNSQAALDGLLWVYVLGTGLGLLAAYVALIGYPLTRARHDEIRAELDRR
ncbi:MAG: MFS transporter [Gammaproteobacteria bacterium]|nr:MFS transporter [Gammaproteobacteria bacterium]|tara:strand:- start:1844 stop:3166 length:1323 start_codon:yes stop_codon:yes gene_type:complete